MIRALWTAATGMAAQALNVDVIANNLANVNTTGFKRGRANFQDLMYQQIKSAGAEASAAGTQLPTGIQVGLGVRAAGIESIFLEGSFKNTSNPLDLAIEGRGFFQILMPNGDLAYTRAGAFSMDNQGQIVTSDGNVLQPAITIPPDALTINIGADGTVSVEQPGGASTVVGQIQLADFSNPAGLTHLGHSLFQANNASGQAITGNAGANGLGNLGQGTLEMSNVNIVEEMVNLIAGQRAYEMNSKAVQAGDEMLQTANNIRRG
ncbi:MAG: flagellar basal-body rod protein FlgG [Zetaproteobacteria bacterium CG12_big_fil_rev_8_21_14_0_65_55_1124]|nr:MAG: flagellar basal-body rod protein FlgG [Zetaproteobacteria bacterium CG1_02_55_237]PIS18668.1 MAG: flagellar basal-body rod protein FlgG [Zetaproteobacteria bacterium CG08_land_8_20_14_0_20_55_17]PIW43273.1 MAG: flagellar basal-body rod protein FlgG [Zetaproteobacteria bacterium CG12_big_fil_rev_8_21_14_0_65_55_1124]PIY53403.1 MAG: flagellar basal-body rod protein FlgG [Zetaproteobacteria bacterium CG_4_10_14_0_8_um_filter_55_43]PIZ38694.1 MAG: flagellar basal-body rod protein FlgG [Zeta